MPKIGIVFALDGEDKFATAMKKAQEGARFMVSGTTVHCEGHSPRSEGGKGLAGGSFLSVLFL